VLPSLVLNYFGQAALLSHEPEAIENPFYRLAPEWGVTPLAVLATMASIIASQALISGAFSLTVQAVQLDYLPRLRVLHTSAHHKGQVYVPLVNWALMIGSVGLVIGFRSSSNLAAAYGIAVTATMVITSLLFFVVARRRWDWPLAKALVVVTPLLLVDSAFLAANVPKIPAGGWFPLLVGLLLLVQMATWRQGRQLVADHLRRGERSAVDVIDHSPGIATVDGTAIFLFKDPGQAPPALISNLRHNRVRHAETYLLAVEITDAPHVDDADRCTRITYREGLHQVVLRYGYLDEVDVHAQLTQSGDDDVPPVDDGEATYFVGREAVSQGDLEGMHPALEHLYVLLHRGADTATRFFKLPPDRVFEVGTPVEI
jgi:KUP system potassium uptake protein